MKRSLLLVFLAAAYFVTNGQIVLSGTATSSRGKILAVYRYTDFFTKTKEQISQVLIDSNGAFKSNCQIDQPQYIEIYLNELFSGFYVQPGYAYELIVDDKGALVEVKSDDPVNTIVKEFDVRDDGLYDFQRKKNYHDKIRDFVQLEKAKMEGLPAFASEILTYRLARREIYLYTQKIDTSALNKIERILFLQSDIKTATPDYSASILSYYYTRANLFSTRYTPFDKAKPLQSLLNEVSFVPVDSIQQLVFLSFLAMAYQRDFKITHEKLNDLTDSIASVTQNHKVQQVARLLKAKNSILIAGTYIRDFSFKDLNGRTASVSDLRGKYVLIDFWYTGCVPCLKNFPNLVKLKDEFPSKLEILSINPEEPEERVLSFLKKRPQYNKWLFTSIDRRDALVTYFNVSGYPSYYLIDPEGKLVKRIDFLEMENDIEKIKLLLK